MSLMCVLGYVVYKEKLLDTQQETVFRLLAELTRVGGNERRALALELHDSLEQGLVALLDGMRRVSRLVEEDGRAACRELGRLEALARETLRDVRRMIGDLRFRVIDQTKRFAALQASLSGDGPARVRAPEDLSSREREVLARIAAGETTREIARALYLSENTIKRHTSNIFQKLHVHHRSQAVAEALRRGLIPPAPPMPERDPQDA
jgi:DNA-binding CsgD family transcriptional regulator